MAVTIATPTGTTNPLQYASQSKLDRRVLITPSVLWSMQLWDVDDTLRFYWSSNEGASWTEDATARISDIHIASGASMLIDTGKGLREELMWISYVTASDFKLRCRRGIMGATTLRWSDMTTSGSKSRIVADGAAAVYADLAVCSGPEGVHFFYCGTATNNVYWRWMRHGSGGDGLYQFALAPEVLVEGGRSQDTWPSGDVRHTGNDNSFQTGDVYMGWASLDPEPTERHRLVRIPAKGIGSYDSPATKRTMLSDDGLAGLNVVRFDGDHLCQLVVAADDPTQPLLHETNGGDTARRTRTPPDPALGNIHSIALSWDRNTHDPYIFAAGATTSFPWYTWYDRSADVWASWVQINSDPVVVGSLSAKRGSHTNRKIELTYAIVSGANRAVRYESITIGNTPPHAPAWVTESGPIDQSIDTILEHRHDDADGDAQAAKKLRRSVNGGAFTWWNGTTWTTESSVAGGSQTTLLTAANNGADGDVIRYTMATSDGVAFGPYGPELVLTGSTPVNPVIDEPDPSDVVTSGRLLLQWTVAEQSAWKARILDAGNVELWPGPRVESPLQREETLDFQLANASTYKVELITYNAEGIASTPIVHQFTTNWLLPPAPTYPATVDPVEQVVEVAITNAAPGGGQVAAVSNIVYRANELMLMDPDDLGEYRVMAVDVPINSTWTDFWAESGVLHRYRVVAVSAQYTTALGA
jgi:hypothetical protein